jgi:hypothetical protein
MDEIELSQKMCVEVGTRLNWPRTICGIVDEIELAQNCVGKCIRD